MSDRKKPSVAFWATVVVVVVLVLYPLSLGPWCWLDCHEAMPPALGGAGGWFFHPIFAAGKKCEIARNVIDRYVALWSNRPFEWEPFEWKMGGSEIHP